MTRRTDLSELRIESPCPESWSAMAGDERRRWCDSCSKHVHDLSNLPRTEVEDLLASAGDARVCVRMERLPGGECVTAETPRAWLSGPGRIAAAALALGAAVSSCSGPNSETPSAQGGPDAPFLPYLVDPGEETGEPAIDEPVDGGCEPTMGDVEILGRIRLDETPVETEDDAPPVMVGEVAPMMGSVAPDQTPPKD